jgi:hypothetical protein
MFVPWLRRLVAGLSLLRPWFAPESVRVGFVVGKVALGHDFLLVLRFFPVSIIPPWPPMLIIVWRMNNGPVGGRGSELSHPIDMNNNNK